MPPANKSKEKEDPELILRKKFLAKCRFRALVRKVMCNLYWLIDDDEVYEGDNVKKRVEQAMRAKNKKAKLLSLADKALLNKPVKERTDSEKKYIYRKIGSLKCFKRYPNHVKRKLAAATYFKYFGPDRVIVRQNQEAEALYFVVTGEVVVSVLIYDELLKRNISINVFVMHSGDMFGEVSLLHNIPRTATCTTSGHCEFLALMAADFKEVLQKSLQKQWDEVSLTMRSFSYFDGLDEVARREGCIVAKMKSFDPDETILGDGVGMNNCVYFVISGSCQMIESLHIITKENLGKKYYSLYDPYVEQKEELDINKKYFQNLKSSETKSKNASIHTIHEEGESKGAECKSEATAVNQDASKDDGVKNSAGKDEAVKDDAVKSSTERKLPRASSLSKSELPKTSGKLQSRITLHSRKFSGKEESSDEPIELSNVLLRKDDELLSREKSIRIVPMMGKEMRTYFMQVCIFHAGSTFGFGENMRDRRIVAITRVDCMVLPLVWLLQKNTANIWSRVKHYLEKKSGQHGAAAGLAAAKEHCQHLVKSQALLGEKGDLNLTRGDHQSRLYGAAAGLATAEEHCQHLVKSQALLGEKGDLNLTRGDHQSRLYGAAAGLATAEDHCQHLVKSQALLGEKGDLNLTRGDDQSGLHGAAAGLAVQKNTANIWSRVKHYLEKKAMTRADSMVLPLVWLLQKNTANIWSRVKHYLEKKIPTKKQLFQHFVQERRWVEWKDSLVEEISSRSRTVNHTTIHDVPYSIRMQEMTDI
ncbi:cyclic nucleotide-binding domain-containing protein [Phthorimaea operculella]|nr:cyclic nucleotide-binding domain-containing protein [Phthorimaea operculella]